MSQDPDPHNVSIKIWFYLRSGSTQICVDTGMLMRTDVDQVYDLAERVQVFVTGADGEQMVLSGPEAAALLAQAGISLGDNDQVFRRILSLIRYSCALSTYMVLRIQRWSQSDPEYLEVKRIRIRMNLFACGSDLYPFEIRF